MDTSLCREKYQDTFTHSDGETVRVCSTMDSTSAGAHRWLCDDYFERFKASYERDLGAARVY